jgi:hypothetical protein
MSDEETTVIDALVGAAQRTPEIDGILVRAVESMTGYLKELDDALSEVQDDPQDIGSRVARSLVLRGTSESVLNLAYERVTQVSS